jgi:hypothetical protein
MPTEEFHLQSTDRSVIGSIRRYWDNNPGGSCQPRCIIRALLEVLAADLMNCNRAVSVLDDYWFALFGSGDAAVPTLGVRGLHIGSRRSGHGGAYRNGLRYARE